MKGAEGSRTCLFVLWGCGPSVRRAGWPVWGITQRCAPAAQRPLTLTASQRGRTRPTPSLSDGTEALSVGSGPFSSSSSFFFEKKRGWEWGWGERKGEKVLDFEERSPGWVWQPWPR